MYINTHTHTYIYIYICVYVYVLRHKDVCKLDVLYPSICTNRWLERHTIACPPPPLLNLKPLPPPRTPDPPLRNLEIQQLCI